MKKTLTIVIVCSALAFLSVGCSKENTDGKLNIFVERLGGNNEKVLVNYDDITNNQWFVSSGSETIGISSGSVDQKKYDISLNSGGNYYINYSGTGAIAAGYPGTRLMTTKSTTGFSTVQIRVKDSGEDLVLFNNGNVKVRFPMAAYAEEGAQSLMFHHVTGAIAFSIKNTTENAVTLSKVNLSSDDNTMWYAAVYDVNSGTVSKGSGWGTKNVSDDYNIKDEDGNSGYALAAGGEVFVILPVPVCGSSVTLTVNLTVTGTVDRNAFSVTLGDGVSANTIYQLNTIQLTNE